MKIYFISKVNFQPTSSRLILFNLSYFWSFINGFLRKSSITNFSFWRCKFHKITYLFAVYCILSSTWTKMDIYAGLLLANYCVQYPHTIPFSRNNLFSLKSFKTMCHLGGCSIQNALYLEILEGKIHNCDFLLNILALFLLNRTHALIF